MSALLPSQVLDAAADLIEPEGCWAQHAYGVDADGNLLWSRGLSGAVCFCMIGAAYRASGSRSLLSKFERSAAITLLAASIGCERYGISDFNDAPGRTQFGAVKALRKAADLARSEGQ